MQKAILLLLVAVSCNPTGKEADNTSADHQMLTVEQINQVTTDWIGTGKITDIPGHDPRRIRPDQSTGLPLRRR
jgi:hypothetical protein